MATENDFPKVSNIKTMIGDGTAIGFEMISEAGAIRFRVETGDLPLLVGKIFSGATEAEKRIRQDPNLSHLTSAIRPIVAISNPTIEVANTMGTGGRGLVGVTMNISGIPFTGAISPEQCRRLAEDLIAAADSQSQHSRTKPS
jgi:hypothetical protein